MATVVIRQSTNRISTDDMVLLTGEGKQRDGNTTVVGLLLRIKTTVRNVHETRISNNQQQTYN